MGGSPKFYPTGNNTDISAFEQQLSLLKAAQGVYSVDEGQLANQLTTLGLTPRVAVTTNGTWYATWRESSDTAHALIYADLVGSEGIVTIADTRTPFFLNPWTGEQSPVLVYEQNSSSTVIPLTLAGNQTVIISFASATNSSVSLAYHVTSIPSNVIGVTLSPNQSIALHVAAAVTDAQATLSNKASCAVSGSSVPAAFELSEWDLDAERWEAPPNVSDATQPTVKFNMSLHLPQLSSWADIPALANSSGIGYYTSTFAWPRSTTYGDLSEFGAYISFDNVLHALRVQINGNRLPPLDLTNAVADISPYLTPGNNTVIATVATPWWNYLRTILGTLESSGTPPIPQVLETLLGLPLPPIVDAGLVPGVKVTPFRRVIC